MRLAGGDFRELTLAATLKNMQCRGCGELVLRASLVTALVVWRPWRELLGR
jgi:hypothetical protein